MVERVIYQGSSRHHMHSRAKTGGQKSSLQEVCFPLLKCLLTDHCHSCLSCTRVRNMPWGPAVLQYTDYLSESSGAFPGACVSGIKGQSQNITNVSLLWRYFFLRDKEAENDLSLSIHLSLICSFVTVKVRYILSACVKQESGRKYPRR